MEELFRFSVVRPATRAVSTPLSLERPSVQDQPNYNYLNIANIQQPIAPQSFQRTLQDAARTKEWAALETQAWIYLLDPTRMNNIIQIINSQVYKQLKNFSVQIRSLDSEKLSPEKWPGGKSFVAKDQWPDDAAIIAKAYNSSANLANRPDFPVGKNKLSEINKYDLADLFLALMIVRAGGPTKMQAEIRSRELWTSSDFLTSNPSLTEIADILRIIDLLLSDPTTVKSGDDVSSLLNKTILFPPAIFSYFEKPIHGIGFRELHVVKQHIRRYEPAEIARIENILKGETRSHIQTHSLTHESSTSTQTDTTTETDKELTSTDKVDIKNEAQNQVKEDTKVDAGVHAQYDGGSFKLQADLTVSYDKSSEQTNKYASEVAKEVTQKAVSKVTQRVTQSQTTKITETFTELEKQGFENKTSNNICGIYQWVEKVYLAQVFNYGRHMIFDIMVPEPGASLLKAATTPPPDQKIPVPPYPLGSIIVGMGGPILDNEGNYQLNIPLNPLDISEDTGNPNFYGHWVARYGATSVEPPPAETINLAITKDVPSEDNTEKSGSDVLRIEDGYGAFSATAMVSWKTNDDTEGGVGSSPNDSYVDLKVGDVQILFRYTDPEVSSLLVTGKSRVVAGSKTKFLNQVNNNQPLEESTIGYVFKTNLINGMTFNLEITCKRTETLLGKWKLQTYEKIANAYQKLKADYDEKISELQYQKETTGPLGAADPLANRQTEQLELKRSCIAILDNDNSTVRGMSSPVSIYSTDAPALPEPILEKAQIQGSRVRWFEQAFEWENIAYVFYPYYWSRRGTWLQKLNLKNDDPLFLKFLQAGYARVIVPVRIGFEWAMLFYLHTGKPWLGGDLPPVGDKTQNPLYLDIAEELKEQTGAPGNEKPLDEEPWEFVLPTTFIKLQKDEVLPEWHREKPYPSEAPAGSWTWEDGPPKP